MLGGEKAIPTAFPDLTLEEAYLDEDGQACIEAELIECGSWNAEWRMSRIRKWQVGI